MTSVRCGEVAQVRDAPAEEGYPPEALEAPAGGEPVQRRDRQEPGRAAAAAPAEVQPGDEGGEEAASPLRARMNNNE